MTSANRGGVDLDVGFARAQFPPLANGTAFLENAGGTYVPRQVIDRVTRYMTELQVQPAYGFAASAEAARLIAEGQAVAAAFLNAGTDEVLVGPSTTVNVMVLAAALRPLLAPGDEIVVTNQDHEANSTPWRRLAETGASVREWPIDPVTAELDLDVLRGLVGPRTRLVVMPHCSNIVGTFNDVGAAAAIARAAGALIAVDGVAYAPHRLPDVKALDVDFYYFSLYKTFGPHVGAAYVRRAVVARLAPQNHFFIEEAPKMLNPGGPSHEFTAALPGIADYFEALDQHHFALPVNSLRGRMERLYGLFAAHEDRLGQRLLAGLALLPAIRLIGRPTVDGQRAPTVSFTVAGRDQGEIARILWDQGIAVGQGDFYARRVVTALGLHPGGVIRVSLAHYNDEGDVDRLLAALGRAIS
ncbi:aminotransferase class V-fold PLP-dependent enzyme [Zavarzinia compransoris]|uniref:aminotransferase class V-fold PLP-dependent enzyme n=1 Tax=Zavarzinia compransoris TaxID=1264899 RepID=UPI001061B49A|nr:aminotransferase class V-fold PLP-dependent enzyme [Zavarzinia compransoris]TDP46941.1 cysteine desulfurase family protein (TIGR01976 family) [Zavarzinia compransoris]